MFEFVSINGQTTKMLIDSGSTEACLSWATARKLGLLERVRDFHNEVVQFMDGMKNIRIGVLPPMTVVLDGVVEAVVRFSVMPEDFAASLLPNTILAAFGCYYQFKPNGDASLSFRRTWPPGVQTI